MTIASCTYREATARNPNLANLGFNHANSLNAAGRHEEALDLYKRDLALKGLRGNPLWDEANRLSMRVGRQESRSLDREREGAPIEP